MRFIKVGGGIVVMQYVRLNTEVLVGVGTK